MKPIKIVIEVVTPESIKRLEEENESLRNEIKKLTGQHNKLHETVYRFMELFGELKRSLKER